jgi:hypothetical protein
MAAKNASVPIRKLAISYARVSSGAQATDDASGLERQKLAIEGWLRAHPDYELDRELRVVGSGAKAGRFEWFIEELQQGRLPRGTCLVVEKISRFSRESVTDVLETLIALFRAGGAIAACELGGDVLDSLDGQNGAVFMLVGAIQRARGEWEERRDRKRGSDAKKRRLIAEGSKPFKARAKGARHSSYPFWLDFDERAGQFKLNDHSHWVRDVFLWAQEIGAVAIAQRLKEQGVRQVNNRRKAISAAHLTTLLRNRAVLGERQHLDHKRRPSGDPVPGVYPPVITPDEWRLAWDAISRRRSYQGPIARNRLRNLFEGRIFCAECQGRIGYGTARATLATTGERKTYYYWRCNTHFKDRSACSAPQRTYDELRILQQLQTFRWDSYFNDARHTADTAAARQTLLATEQVVAEAQQAVAVIISAQDDFLAQGRAYPARLDEQQQQAERLLQEAESDRDAARSVLQGLQTRRTGAAAAAAVQERVGAFLASDRDDIEHRLQFNRWLFAEGIVALYDTQADVIELGTGKVCPQGQLIELDQVLEDAAVLGLDPAMFRP